jgi:hypothetical protein
MRLFGHCAKPHGKFEIWEVSTNYCNISLPEAKERCHGEMDFAAWETWKYGKMSDAFVMPKKCGLPRVHIQKITLSGVEYEI